MESTIGSQPVRIFLIGLGEGFSRSVARYVSSDTRVVLTGVAPSLALSSMLLPLIGVDLVLLDWTALGPAPPDTVRMLRAGHPSLRIVCMANEGEPYRTAAARVGADAVISQDGFAGEFEILLCELFPGRFAESGGRND